MTTPTIPPIDPDDLSQQADPERVARIWARLEPEVSAMAGRRARGDRWSDRLRPRGSTWLIAAALGGVLAGGIWIGRSSAPRGRGDEVSVPIASTSDVTLDLFATGSKSKTFALPNGGSLMLDPETTVEVAELSDASMVLRLLRGTASVDGTHLVGGTVSIVAGEARMTAPAGGSMAVRRNASDVDVIAMGRPVEVDSPLGHRTVASGERLHAVPTRTTTANVVAPAPLTPPVDPDITNPAPTSRGPLTLARDPASTDPADPPSGKEVKPPDEPADWLVKYQANDWRGAYQALDQSGGAAGAIERARSATELSTLCDVMRMNGRSDLAIKAAKRIIDEFPGDPLAQPFAITLANLYDGAGRSDLAQEVLLRVGKSPLQEDVVCRQLRQGSPGDPAIVSLAQQYIGKYGASSTNGPSAFPPQCMDEAESIVADAAEKAAEQHPTAVPPTDASATPSASSSSAPAPSTSSSAPASSASAPPNAVAPTPSGKRAVPAPSASAAPAGGK